MVDAYETPSTPPPPPDSALPPKQGMSTGVKVAIGCGILLALVVIGIVVATVAGGLFLKNKAEDFSGGLEEQERASTMVAELEEEHPFTPPADGAVDGGRAETFFEVTDDAWESMQEWVEEMESRGQDIEERGGEAGFGDAMAGMRGLGGARVAVAEALADHEMPASEYLWTGLSLIRAYEGLDQPAEETGVPPANLELAAEHRAELEELASGDQAGSDKSAVLGIAWTWASEGTTRALGWDTLGQYVPQSP